MTKIVAVINSDNEVIAINRWEDSYELQDDELLVTNPAYIGGKFMDGFFYAPQPYPSWTPLEGNWIPPVAMPEDGKRYDWDEDAQEWISVEANA